ncbi:MAG: rhomboid family intramembrane serine protease [Lentisphaeria bacterium]|nr:rhomboid family intramembrane serine protease [Lentisphaeria bacterium]
MPIHNRDWYQESSSYGSSYGGRAANATPTCTRILIVTIAVYVAQIVISDGRVSYVTQWLAVTPDTIPHGQIWRLLTYAFCHSPSELLHIVLNMLFLWIFGRRIEQKYGSREFLLFYLVAALCASVLYCLLHSAFGQMSPMLGASGSVMAVVILFAMLYPRERLYLLGLIPIEARWFALVIVIYDLHPVLMMLGNKPVNDNVAHAAHVGGLAFGFCYWLYKWRLEYWWQWLTGWFRMKRHGRKVQPRRRVANDPEAPTSKPTLAGVAQKKLTGAFDEEIDRILEKVATKGVESLNERERALLESASERYETEE